MKLKNTHEHNFITSLVINPSSSEKYESLRRCKITNASHSWNYRSVKKQSLNFSIYGPSFFKHLSSLFKQLKMILLLHTTIYIDRMTQNEKSKNRICSEKCTEMDHWKFKSSDNYTYHCWRSFLSEDNSLFRNLFFHGQSRLITIKVRLLENNDKLPQ